MAELSRTRIIVVILFPTVLLSELLFIPLGVSSNLVAYISVTQAHHPTVYGRVTLNNASD